MKMALQIRNEIQEVILDCKIKESRFFMKLSFALLVIDLFIALLHHQVVLIYKMLLMHLCDFFMNLNDNY